MHDRHSVPGDRSGEQNSAYERLGPSQARVGNTPAPLTLVTGGAGFIGSALVRRLAAGGTPVRVLDDFSTGRRERIDGLPGVEILEGRVEDPEAVRTACSGVRRVVHLAALASVPRAEREPEAAARGNVQGTLSVVVGSRNACVQALVYASSCSVYGDAGDQPIHENVPLRPQSVYAVTKLAGERHALLGHRTGGPPAVALRFFNVYGPGQPADSPYSGVLARFAAAARAGEPAEIHGDGEQTRDFVAVSDVVEAILLGLDGAAGPAGGQAFNIGTGEAASVNQVWELVARASGVRLTPRCGPGRSGDMRSARADTGLAQRVLGFRARTGLAEGIAALVAKEPREAAA